MTQKQRANIELEGATRDAEEDSRMCSEAPHDLEGLRNTSGALSHPCHIGLQDAITMRLRWVS